MGQTRKRPQTRPDSKPKIAFCFLLYDNIVHQKLWEDFFAQDKNDLATVYAHLKSNTARTPAWIKKHSVRSVKTDWCGEGQIHGLSQMLKKALSDPNNKYFVFLSGACIPLYNFCKTYKKITRSPKARVYYNKRKNEVFEGRSDVYTNWTWMILNRKTAQDFIRLSDKQDRKAQRFIAKMRKLYRDHGALVGNFKTRSLENSRWVGWCPDETYPIQWFVELYKPSGLAKHITKQMTTYALWDYEDDYDHPQILNAETVKRHKKQICGRGHIFARKFTKDGAAAAGMKC